MVAMVVVLVFLVAVAAVVVVAGVVSALVVSAVVGGIVASCILVSNGPFSQSYQLQIASCSDWVCFTREDAVAAFSRHSSNSFLEPKLMKFPIRIGGHFHLAICQSCYMINSCQ